MRFFWRRLFLVLLILSSSVSSVSFVAAQTTINSLTKFICAPGTTVKSSGAVYSVAQAKLALQALLQTSNFCTNEKITVTGFLGNVLQDQMTCVCTSQAQFNSVGCG